jgi:hypothetical protein
MKMVRFLLVILTFLALHNVCWCQQGRNDTIPSPIKGKPASGFPVADTLHGKGPSRYRKHQDSPYKVDSATKKKHDPRKATLYSTFVPGLGQIYNHKYWKLPLVYAAVGIPAYTFFSNHSQYQKAQYALGVLVGSETTGVAVTPEQLAKVDPQMRYAVQTGQDNSLRTYRNEFRQYQDYSVLFFLLFWGLQVVDATVDAHLMYFDVSDQLSMHLQQPSGNALGLGSASGATGLSLVFDLHKSRSRPLYLP